MPRVIRSKLFVLSSVSFALITAAVGAIASIRAPAGQAIVVDGGAAKMAIRRLPDGTLDPADLAAAAAEGEKRRRSYEEQARQRALERYNTWQGTKTYIRTGARIEGHGAYDAVSRAFGNDPPAPPARLREFAHFLNRAPEYKVVGWRAGVVSITPNDQGWQATVRVNPTLATLKGGIPYTPRVTVETWQVAEDGTATVVDAQGEGLHMLIVD